MSDTVLLAEERSAVSIPSDAKCNGLLSQKFRPLLHLGFRIHLFPDPLLFIAVPSRRERPGGHSVAVYRGGRSGDESEPATRTTRDFGHQFEARSLPRPRYVIMDVVAAQLELAANVSCLSVAVLYSCSCEWAH